METTLDGTELRVLGSLVEKELTTPEYYPLSLNALVNACNQKSNRDPVLSLDESQVTRALDTLRFKQYALVSGSGGRVVKYRHALVEKFRFSPAELAILCELMLRGPQTVGELRGRGERMHKFADLSEVESVLADLAERTPSLVVRLPLQPGRKEPRYCQLFSGEPDLSELAVQMEARGAGADGEKMARLEQELSELREEVAALRETVAEFRKSFE
jgi:uncharacterized protein YceH (UPF0502 family)